MPSAQDSVGFGRPGGERCQPSKSRPIDLVHLSRQTLGDRALEEEVLGLFLRQIDKVAERLARADDAERRRIAHALVGSARGVGAFAVADCAAEIEKSGYNAHLGRQLAAHLDKVSDFIASISR